MSEVYKKREVLVNPDIQSRIDIIQSKVAQIKKVKDEEIKKPNVDDEIEFNTFLWKASWVVIEFISDLWIDLAKYTLGTTADILKSIADWIIPDWLKSFFSENMDGFISWYNKRTKKDKIIHLIDEIYISNFSIRKEKWKYIVKDYNWDEITTPGLLDIFNEPGNTLSETLDEVLISRSLTEDGKKWVLSTIRHLNIDIANESDIEWIDSKDLANAYLLEYNVLDSNWDVYKLSDVTSTILDNITPVIPNHIKDYILMTNVWVFDNNDMSFFQDALSEYRKVSIDTKSKTRKTKEIAEWWINNIVDFLQNPLSALANINNGMSKVWLIFGLWYYLFVSEHRKKVWGAILWIYSTDALTDIFDWENWSWGFDWIKKWSKEIFNILDSDLEERGYIKKITENPNETQLILELTTLKSSILFENFTVDKSWAITNIEVNNLINWNNLDKYVPSIYKTKTILTESLKDMLKSFLILRKQWNETLDKTKLRLEQTYNTTDYPNVRFGEVLLVELSEEMNTSSPNQTVFQQAQVVSTQTQVVSSQAQVTTVASQVQLEQMPNEYLVELNKLPDVSTRNDLMTKINMLIKWTFSKTDLISTIDWYINLPFINISEKNILIAIKELIINNITN